MGFLSDPMLAIWFAVVVAVMACLLGITRVVITRAFTTYECHAFMTAVTMVVLAIEANAVKNAPTFDGVPLVDGPLWLHIVVPLVLVFANIAILMMVIYREHKKFISSSIKVVSAIFMVACVITVQFIVFNLTLQHWTAMAMVSLAWIVTVISGGVMMVIIVNYARDYLRHPQDYARG